MPIDPIVQNTIVTGLVAFSSAALGTAGGFVLQSIESDRRAKSARRNRIIKAYSVMNARFNNLASEYIHALVNTRVGVAPFSTYKRMRIANLAFGKAVWQVALVETDSNLRDKVLAWATRHPEMQPPAAERNTEEEAVRQATHIDNATQKLRQELLAIINEVQRVHGF